MPTACGRRKTHTPQFSRLQQLRRGYKPDTNSSELARRHQLVVSLLRPGSKNNVRSNHGRLRRLSERATDYAAVWKLSWRIRYIPAHLDCRAWTRCRNGTLALGISLSATRAKHRHGRSSSTDGGLVFGGDYSVFIALESGKGKELWRFNTGMQIAASPITYLVDGKQQITLVAGMTVLTFSLDGK